MQQVLNTTERSQTFWKFLLFFIITIAVILLAVYFDFKMPIVENKKLKAEIADQREVNAEQEKFAVRVERVSSLLDSMEKNPADAEVISTKVDAAITDLNSLAFFQETGISSSARIYNKVVDKLSKVKELLKKINGLNQQNSKLKEDLQRYKDELDRPVQQQQQ
jgi:Type VI secretion system, TssO